MAKTITNNLDMIAKGHDNYAGLTNIELIAVGGNTPHDYLEPVDDLGLWSYGQSRVTGDGIARDDGYSSTGWQVGALAYAQRTYLKHSILGGKRSGNVTIKTRRDEVPVDSTSSYKYIIANAVMTMLPLPEESKYIAGVTNFVYRFDRIEILHEDKMYGELTLDAGSTAQENIGTTAVLLTGFAADGESDGVTVAHASDSLTCIIAGVYEVYLDIEALSDASHKWTFTFYKNAATTSAAMSETISTVAKNVSFGRKLDLAAGDVMTTYVNSDDGGDTADITLVNGRFGMESVTA